MEAALAVTRFGHFSALMFVFGANAYLWAFAPAPLPASLAAPIRRWSLAASGAALATALIWFLLEGASMSGDWRSALDPDVLGDVLLSTNFGSVWIARTVLLIALVGVLAQTQPHGLAAATIVSGLALASLSLIDHGAMQAGVAGVAHRVNDAAHLLIAGGWLGGLPPFVLCLSAARRPESAEFAHQAMLRFSAIGHFAVVALLITGAANIALTTGHLPWPPTSPYRALLLAKLAVVATMIALAIYNRYALLPDVETSADRAAALSRFAFVEFALALLAVALVSYFGLLDPT